MRNYFYYDADVEEGQGRFFDVLPTADNGCIAAGVAYNPVNAPYPPGHSQDTWVVKVDSMGCVVPGCDGHKANISKVLSHGGIAGSVFHALRGSGA